MQVPSDLPLRRIVGGDQYLYITMPGPDSSSTDDLRLVAIVKQGQRFPLQFGREVMCRMLGAPDRVNWKQCALGKDAESAKVEAFRKVFAKHEPSIE